MAASTLTVSASRAPWMRSANGVTPLRNAASVTVAPSSGDSCSIPWSPMPFLFGPDDTSPGRSKNAVNTPASTCLEISSRGGGAATNAAESPPLRGNLPLTKRHYPEVGCINGDRPGDATHVGVDFCSAKPRVGRQPANPGLYYGTALPFFGKIHSKDVSTS